MCGFIVHQINHSDNLILGDTSYSKEICYRQPRNGKIDVEQYKVVPDILINCLGFLGLFSITRRPVFLKRLIF